MDANMAAMFPKGIRALMIDDDAKFLKSATTLLSVMNFVVMIRSSVAYALKSLTSGNLKGFDVILVHAPKAAACGFDFRAIVETDLLIPVIYFLEEDHEATGDEADELMRTLQAPGSYIIKKPLDVDEVRTRLWTVIAFRKCALETKARRGGEAGLDAGGDDDEDRVHFKVVMKGRGRKRKSNSSSKRGGSSGTAATAVGGHPAAKGMGKENVISQQQPAQQQDGRAKKTQKDGGGEAFNLLPQPNTTMMNGQQHHVQQQPKPSDLFMQSILRRTLAVPPNNNKFFTNATVPSYNPKFFFSAAAGPSSAAAAAFGNTITTTGGAPAAPRALYSATPSALHPVARQKQQPSAQNFLFGNIAPPAAAPTMATTTATAYELPQFSEGISNKQQQQDVHPLLMFGPFPYHGPTPPLPPVVQQDILAPAAAGAPFTGGVAGGGMTGGATAAAATEAIAYGNEVGMADPPVAPQHVVSNALDEVAMLEMLLSDGLYNYSAGSSFVVPDDHQVLGMAPNLNELTTMAGGALGSNNVVSLTASHQVLSDNNGDHQQQGVPPQLMFGPFPYQGSAPQPVGDLFAGGMAGGDTAGGASGAAATEAVAYGNDVSLSFLQPPNTIAEQDGDGEVAGLMGMDLDASMADPPLLPQHISDALFNDDFNDCNEDDTSSFPLDALLGDLHGPMFEFDDDADLDAMPDDGAGASLVAGEEGGSENGLENLAGLDIPHDVMQLNDFPFPQPKNKNNVRE